MGKCLIGFRYTLEIVLILFSIIMFIDSFTTDHSLAHDWAQIYFFIVITDLLLKCYTKVKDCINGRKLKIFNFMYRKES